MPDVTSSLIRQDVPPVGVGYLLLMAVVVVYYYGVARVGGAFITSAFTGCALLIALSTPVYALAAWLAARRRAREKGPDRDPPAPGITS